ncbi:hypothetical protein, partial [Methanoculleus sp. UBA291]|uniref:hypothetical protein n=1 Tax=Methanoculleus sp. UBA291 TaxID=1915495 RepID=UPI00316AE963
MNFSRSGLYYGIVSSFVQTIHGFLSNIAMGVGMGEGVSPSPATKSSCSHNMGYTVGMGGGEQFSDC